MSLVILQPSGNQGAREHYLDTIENRVAIDSCQPYLEPKTFELLKSVHPSGSAGMWGVVAGKNQVNISKWNKIGVGDLVLFASDKQIKAAGIVSAKFISERLSKYLWSTNRDGDTWKYMYSLDEIKEINISYEDFNAVVGYKTNNIIQGFTVMDEEKSSKFLDHYALRSDRHLEDVTEEEFLEALKELDGDLDRRASSWHRKEQARGRRMLLRGKTEGECQICQRKLASEFLIAAHIKRRSECSDQEKRDLSGVMMLACKFGCDYLFEAGHIGVNSDGVIQVSPKLNDQIAQKYISEFKNIRVKMNSRQATYFDWHLVNRFIK